MNKIDLENYDVQENSDKTITLRPKKSKYWEPSQFDRGWAVAYNGKIEITYPSTLQDLDNRHCVFETRALAERADYLQRRSNAIIRACLLVDPDYVPDWGIEKQMKHLPYYEYVLNEWCIDDRRTGDSSPAYVSSREKCAEVIKLLTKWGVK